MPPKVNRQIPPPTPPGRTGRTPTSRFEPKQGDLFDRIGPMEELSDDFLKVLLYGSSGTGKTTTWATFPKPIFCVLCSGGLQPGEMKSIREDRYKGHIDAVSLHTAAEAGDLLEELANVIGGHPSRFPAKYRRVYQTVVLDHVTGFSDLILKDILGLEKIPTQKSWGMATQQTYGQVTLQAKEYLRSFLNLPAHVVFVAQERSFGGKDDGMDPGIVKPTIGAAVTPSLAGWLNPACDYVLQTFKRPRLRKVETDIAGEIHTTYERDRGVDYCARCEPHDVFMTKFRVPKGHVLPDVIVDPTYDKIMAVIDGQPLG